MIQAVGGPIRRYRNASRTFRPIFVCGAMGGGTSLLAVQLGQAFECAGVVYESANDVSPESFLHVPGPEAFPDVATYRAAIEPQSAWSHAAARADLLGLYRSSVSRSGTAVVDKGPNTNLVRARFFAECFPDAAFVLIFRDAAANIEGFRRKWKSFAEAPLDASIEFYASIHETFLSASAAFLDRTFAVDYDAWVEDNEAQLRALGARLGLAPASRRHRLRARGNVEGRGIRNVKGREVGVVTDANTRARARLGEADCERIDTALHDLRERLLARVAAQNDAGPRHS